jgi:ubiquitin-conjugating enzyme E2 M
MPPKRKTTGDATRDACLIRLQKDLDEIGTLGPVDLSFPEPSNPQRFIVAITPPQGLWRGGKHLFEFNIPDEWPHKHPEIKILTRIWHPNIEELPKQGVCLNIIRKNYNPTITITNLIVGLQFLFNEPNPTDPLNIEAANQYLSNYAAFKLKAEDYVQNYCED